MKVDPRRLSVLLITMAIILFQNCAPDSGEDGMASLNRQLTMVPLPDALISVPFDPNDPNRSPTPATYDGGGPYVRVPAHAIAEIFIGSYYQACGSGRSAISYFNAEHVQYGMGGTFCMRPTESPTDSVLAELRIAQDGCPAGLTRYGGFVLNTPDGSPQPESSVCARYETVATATTYITQIYLVVDPLPDNRCMAGDEEAGTLAGGFTVCLKH